MDSPSGMTPWPHLAGAAVLLAALSTATSAAPPTLELTLAHTPDGLALDWPNQGPGVAYSVQTRSEWGADLWLLPTAPVPWPLPAPPWLVPTPLARQQFFRVLAVPAAERGKLLRSEFKRTLSALEINFLLQLLEVPLTVPGGVRLYQLVYETVDPWGARSQASAGLILPENPTRPLPLLSYQHGTLVRKTDAPSTFTGTEFYLGVVMAATGYAAVLPDLLGLGESPGLHPYHHARSTATASVDALRAARTQCARMACALSSQLFLVGYSHGGHSTLALQRELETYHSDEFAVTAAAPMAGAYDLSGVTAEDLLSGRPVPNPYYSAYLLAAYQAVYGFAPSWAAILSPPYDTQVPPLFNGQTSGGQINAALPAAVTQALAPAFLEAFRNQPNHPLRAALRDNDLYSWTPRAPVRLYHCRGDQDVPFANSQVAQAGFAARGVTVPLLDLDPTADHGACFLPSILDARAWFDSMRD